MGMANLVELWHDLAVPGCGSLGVTGLRRVWRGLPDLVLGLAGLGGLRQGSVGLMRSNRAWLPLSSFGLDLLQ